jgi:glycosyltransferase involved in cell wall biosynthesis
MGQTRVRPLLKVCLLSPSALPIVTGEARHGGGAELDVWQIGRALARAGGFDVSLAAIGETAGSRTIDGVRVVSIARYRPGRTRRGYFLRYCARVVRTLRAIDADVYLCKGASLEALLCFAAARAGRRRRFVFRFQHDWETSRDTLASRIFGGQRRLAGMFTMVLRRADALLTQTRAQALLLEAGFGLHSTVIYNSHEIPAPPDLAAKRTVLWVGRAASYKRPGVFTALARRFPGWPFVMIATKDDSQPAVFDAVRAESAEAPNLTLIGGATRREVDAHFVRARVFVLTSEAEGFPNVLVEAWKTGTAVATLRVDPDGLIREHDAGLVAGDDVDALARGLERLLTDDGEFERVALNGYRLARERLDVDRTVALYRPLLGGRDSA